MNLGLYEIMDRVSVIQSSLEDNVRHHQEADSRVVELVDEAQEVLNMLYQYAASEFYDSYGDCESHGS